jgi:hypothetical protein
MLKPVAVVVPVRQDMLMIISSCIGRWLSPEPIEEVKEPLPSGKLGVEIGSTTSNKATDWHAILIRDYVPPTSFEGSSPRLNSVSV